MSTASVDKNTAFTTRVTVMPAVCAHCHKPSSNPPAWIKFMEAMAPGRGAEEQAYSASLLAKKVALSRQRANLLIAGAIKAGVLEIPKGISGAKVYRRTWYGRQILGRWKSLGWKGGR
jgi:hypothetical protein